MSPVISIILLNWNGREDLLDNCLNSIKNQTFKDWELFMVDNGSTNGSLEYVQEKHPWVPIVKFDQNYGYSGGLNKQVPATKGKYLVFIQNDVKLTPNFLEVLYNKAESDPEIGILVPKQMKYDGSGLLNFGVLVDLLGYPMPPRGDKFFYADGAIMFLRRDLFVDLGMFDDKHFAFFEDCDLSWRTRIVGKKIVLVPEAVAYHWSGGTVTGGALRQGKLETTLWRRQLGERNNLRNVIKNYQWFNLLWVLPLYLLVNIWEILFFLLTGKLKIISKVYLNSYWYNLKNLGDTLRERRKIQSKRKVSDGEIMKQMENTIAKLKILFSSGMPKFKE